MLVDNFSVSIFAFYFTNESCNRATTAFEKKQQHFALQNAAAFCFI